MNIDSVYIQKKEFHTAFKGYNMEEVDKFLDIIAVEFDRLLKKNQELQESLDRSNFGNAANDEDTSRLVSEVLLSAHKVADEIKKKAEKEAITMLEKKKNAEEAEINNLVERKKVINFQLEQSQNAYDKLLTDIKSVLSEFSVKIDELKTNLKNDATETAAAENIFTDPEEIKGKTEPLESSDQKELDKEENVYLRTENDLAAGEEQKDMIELEEDKKIRDFIESGTSDEENKIHTAKNFHTADEQISEKRIFDRFEEEKIYKDKRNPDIGNPDIIDEFFGDNE